MGHAERNCWNGPWQWLRKQQHDCIRYHLMSDPCYKHLLVHTHRFLLAFLSYNFFPYRGEWFNLPIFISQRVNLKEETRTFIVLQTELTPYYFEFRIFTDKNWHWVGLSSCNLRDCNRMAFSFHILFKFGQTHFLCVCVSFYFWCNDLVMIPLSLSIDNDIFRP